MPAKTNATPSSNRKEILKLVVSLAAIAAAVGIWYGRHQNGGSVYDSFAQCLTQKKATMYGLYWCEHCAEQKEMFGNAPIHQVRGMRHERRACRSGEMQAGGAQ